MAKGDTEKIRGIIEMLKASGFNGCITGSSMTGCDFDDWDETPDVDVFVYNRSELMYATGYLLGTGRFDLLSEGEKVKIGWIREGSFNRKYQLDTVKLVSDGIIVNLTWKKGCASLMNVLATFDMTVIMVGYDIPRGITLDLRTGAGQNCGEWPDNPWTAYPNPLLLIKDTVFDVAYATRQFDRVIKYWNRPFDGNHNFDTRPMARFYMNKIDAVISKGALFKTETSKEIFEQFKEEQTEMKAKIGEWLEDKEEI